MAKRIALAGGGSGGHLYPLVAVADYLRKNYFVDEGVEFLFLGPKGEMEKSVMNEYEVPAKFVTSGKMRRYFSFQNFVDAIKIPAGIFQALWHLFWFMPDVVFAKGGFASVPVVIAAKFLFIPVLIHESDAEPGLANRFMGSIADKVAISFERAKIHFPPSRTFVSGSPIKEEALNGDRQRAMEFLSMKKEGKPVILFLGGSQGAKKINDEVLKMLPELAKKYQVVHQTGRNNYDEVVDVSEKLGFKLGHSDYYPLAYIGKEMKDVIELADVVVSRAGSNAISELAANGKAVILVPIFNSANNHQRINAFEVAKEGGAIVLEEDNFTPGLVLHKVGQLIDNVDARIRMIESFRKFYQPEAKKNLAEAIIGLMSKS